MASGLDQIKQALKNNRADALLVAAALATGESKAKAVGGAIKDWGIYKMIGPAGIVLAAFKGLESVTKVVLRNTGGLEGVLKRMSQIKGLEGQFKSMLGSIALARTRVAELVQFTAKQKLFDLDGVGAAAKELEVLTRSAYVGGDALDEMGASAAISKNRIEDVARATGEFHRALADGQPVNATAGALADMGVISGQTADRLVKLQSGGADSTIVFAALRAELQKNKGSLEEYGKTAEGLNAELEKTQKTLAMGFAEPFKEQELSRIKDTLAVMSAMQPVVQSLGSFLSGLVTPFENISLRAGAWLQKMGALSPVLSVAVAGIKAFTYGLLTLGIAFSALAIGKTIAFFLSLSGVAGKGGASLAALASSANAATASVRALAQGNGSLAASQAVVAASSLRAGVALATMAVAGRVLGFVVKALLVGSGIGLLVALLGTLAEKTIGAAKAAEELAKAQQDQANAHGAVNASLDEQIAKIASLDDAQQALITTNEQLAAAYDDLEKKRKILQQEEAKKDTFTGWMGSLLGESAEAKQARATMPDAQSQIDSLQARKAALSRGMTSGAAGISAQQEDVIRQQAARDLELQSMARNDAIGRATGSQKLLLMEQARQSEKSKADEGSGLSAERAALAAKAKQMELDAGGTSEAVQAKISGLYRGSSSPIIREEQSIRDAEGKGENVQARRAALAVRRADIEDGQSGHARNAQGLASQIEQERKAQALNAADLNAEKQIAELRDRGFDREEAAAKARLESLQMQKAVLESFGDMQGAEQAQIQVAAAERELRLMQERAALQRSLDASHLAVVKLEVDAATAAARGQFAQADAMKQQADALRDAAEMKASVDGKLGQGYTQEQADAAAAQEQAQRVREREAQKEQFRISAGRDIEMGRLANSGSDDDARKLVAMQDDQAFRDEVGNAMARNIPAAEAARIAMGKSVNSITASAGAPIAQSLTRVGGGGGVSDPVLSVQERIRALNERMADSLAKIAGENPGGPAGNAPADVGDKWNH